MKSTFAWLWCVAVALTGCTSIFNSHSVRSQSPEEPKPEKPSTRLVGDFAVPYGMFPVRIESIGLVTGLHGTGSDPAPSAQREMLLEEMRTRGVKNPNALLASKETSMVIVQGILRPGIRQGDHFDVEVRVPSRSETTSLQGGYLLECRLKEMAVLGDKLREGNSLALAQGPVMVDPTGDGKGDQTALGRGRILGGGTAQKSRDLGLVLTPDHQNVFNASRIANAVNRRFYTFEKGVQTGVAKAKTDKFVELIVHPRYKDNIARYVQVVQAIAIQETDAQMMERVAALEKRMMEPDSACEAALQLEAIGKQGVDVLLKAVSSKDLEVRFYSAEALAYLDRREAAEPLGRIARDESAFRVFALTALSAMADYAAYEQLRDLLEVPSAETRYGAFRALWAMNPKDPLVVGARISDEFSYHLLDSSGPPMVHVTHNRRPEVVLFGKDQTFRTPLYVNAGNQIMVVGTQPDEISVSKYAVNAADQKRIVSAKIDDVIRAIVELGGTYPDVVQALQEAKKTGSLTGRFEVDALPEAGRTFQRYAEGGEENASAADLKSAEAKSPAPELFSKKVKNDDSKASNSADNAKKSAENEDNSEKKQVSKSGWLARIFGSDSK
jgi:flagellar basal body P-ring protein FlgI